MNDTYLQVCTCNWAAEKQADLRQTSEYITHLHQHTWSIHNSYVSKMYIQNIANIFAGFWIRACWKIVKSAKINVPRIFPRLQYYSKHFTVYHYPRSLDSISILHSQCTFSTPWVAFWPCATFDGKWTRNPLIQSQRFNSIYHGTSTWDDG